MWLLHWSWLYARVELRFVSCSDLFSCVYSVCTLCVVSFLFVTCRLYCVFLCPRFACIPIDENDGLVFKTPSSGLGSSRDAFTGAIRVARTALPPDGVVLKSLKVSPRDRSTTVSTRASPTLVPRSGNSCSSKQNFEILT